MPPKRKSTAGGQLAGISRAGPGMVEISLMIPQPSTTIHQSSNAPMSHAINTGPWTPASHSCAQFAAGWEMIRQKVKMTWPMVVVNLSLESMKDNYLGLTVRDNKDNVG
ncbi:uncharacterized protein EDB91DRAFT_1081840 [Suillus paluster]|uniref:uncharacterized protein n=1 Tax=Suillus paluster TaxID=48578 RepID=UPI001B86B19E|nr:uncharacterized protein EDB91DRAFT_1081840 [Suillus paluster]KAG1740740.1 hypothetical protein EDB91DRAFT_1081840 [Suillus paluster]